MGRRGLCFFAFVLVFLGEGVEGVGMGVREGGWMGGVRGVC